MHYRVPNDAVFAAHKWGGAMVGIPIDRSLPFDELLGQWAQMQKIFASRVDFQGVTPRLSSLQLVGGYWGVEVGFDSEAVDEWSSRGESPLLAWWDGIFHKGRGSIYPLEVVP